MADKGIYNDDVERLAEIKDEIMASLNEAEQILRGTSEEERARRYWWAHIRCALDNDHMYLGGSMITMQETIDALATYEYDEDDDTTNLPGA